MSTLILLAAAGALCWYAWRSLRTDARTGRPSWWSTFRPAQSWRFHGETQELSARYPGGGDWQCLNCARRGFTADALQAHTAYYHRPRPGVEDRPEWGHRK